MLPVPYLPSKIAVDGICGRRTKSKRQSHKNLKWGILIHGKEVECSITTLKTMRRNRERKNGCISTGIRLGRRSLASGIQRPQCWANVHVHTRMNLRFEVQG